MEHARSERALGKAILMLWACAIAGAGLPAMAAERTLVPGTRVSLEIPREFELADDFTGILWRDAGTSVLAAELPTAAAQMQANLTREALATRGLTMVRRDVVSAAIGEAVLIEASQSARGVEMRKWILVGGNSANTVMLTGSVPAAVAGTVGPVVRDVLLGAQWDPTLTPARNAAFAFEFAETDDLKIARNMGGAIVMTPGGEQNTTSPLGPAVIISRTTSASDVRDLAALAKRRLSETRTVSDVAIREEAAVDLAGMPAHEIMAGATAHNGEPVTVYQLVGYDGTNLVFVQAFAPPALDSRYLPQFRTIGRSLRPRGSQ